MDECPRCGRKDKFPALSRSDNKTMVCSLCGTAEAIWQFKHPDKSVPPVTDGPIW